MGIFGNMENGGLIFLGFIVLVFETLAFGQICFVVVLSIWDSPQSAFDILKESWSPIIRPHSIDVHNMKMEEGDVFTDEDSPRVSH